MADKFIDINSSGRLRERTPIAVSAGAGDADKIIKTDGNGQVDPSFLPGTSVTNLIAFEAISARDAVNIFDDGGVGKIRKANAATGLEAHGFAPSAISATVSGRVVLDDELLAGFAGLTIGATYFLSATTAGLITATPPTTAGYLLQRLGVARSTTELAIDIDVAVERG